MPGTRDAYHQSRMSPTQEQLDRLLLQRVYYNQWMACSELCNGALLIGSRGNWCSAYCGGKWPTIAPVHPIQNLPCIGGYCCGSSVQRRSRSQASQNLFMGLPAYFPNDWNLPNLRFEYSVFKRWRSGDSIFLSVFTPDIWGWFLATGAWNGQLDV